MGWSGTSAHAVYTLFGHFCYGCDLGDHVLPTLRGASGDALIVYAYLDMKGRFLQSLALLRAGQNQCHRREMTVSTNKWLT